MVRNAPENATVAVFESARDALDTLGAIRDADFEPANLSVAARSAGAHATAWSVGAGGGGIRYRGPMAEVWDELWRSLREAACFSIPGVGTVLVAGRLARWMTAALDNSALFGGLSAFGAGLYSIGIERADIAGYERALRAGKCLMLICGTAGQVATAKVLLGSEP